MVPALLVAGLVAYLGIQLARRPPGPPDAPPDAAAPPAADPFPLPTPAPSPFRNTGSDARYVGSAACVPCHRERAESFRRTGMGVSMAEAAPAAEPPDGSVAHTGSDRLYQVERHGGTVWHRELLRTDRTVLGEYPVRYAVGSGRHAKTYLCEADGFLAESPASWYAARGWDLSPGYEGANNAGFGRGIGENCLYCHAGRAEPVGGSPHKMRVAEAAIGCERCHGPGSLHADRHRGGGGPGGTDDTIVNPARLSRDLAEAVCQQCHFHAAAMATVRGRRLDDFRPGLPIEDFRQEYVLQAPGGGMTVVGHVEQMHQSRCYTASGTMTCTTCHDPHDPPPADARVGYYRRACLTCHTPASCKLPEPRRAADAPGDDCAKCHMPRSPTDVQHVAFTHHRIGVHSAKAAPAAAHPGADAELRPWRDNPRLSELDRKRGLGLAYTFLAPGAATPAQVQAYKRRGAAALSEVHAAGVADPVVETELALLRLEAGQPALPLALLALSRPGIQPGDRCGALFVAGAERFKRGELPAARDTFAELVTLRRQADDWLFLAECEQRLGNPTAAAAAGQRAVAISPRLRGRIGP